MSRLLAGLLPCIFVILVLFFFTAKMHNTLHCIRPQYHFQKTVTDIVSILAIIRPN